MEKRCSIQNCGGFVLGYSFLFPETRLLFEGYLTEETDCSKYNQIRITPEFMQENRWLVDENEESQPFIEFQCLMLATGNALLTHKRALFHGAAFLWREKAWIITAPSGTGKTTQLKYWNKTLRREIQVINGDKPLLECRDDGSVWVHSSPWRGKEKLGRPDMHAPLGGILLLEQGGHNEIRRLTSEEAVLPLFVEFVSYPESEDQIRGQAQIMRQILDTVPVWKLVNIGDEASARLTQQTLENYLEDAKDE